MASKKKLLQAAAGSAGGAGLDVGDVFSTYVYDGSSSGQTITNGIDLSGEGGLVWTKDRTSTSAQHALFDTERGVLKGLASSSTAAEANETGSVTAFNSNGYTLGTWSGVNYSGIDYVSWTFRKAPKFFDVVTYSGTGSAQNISHSLGSVPGMIIIKHLTYADNWYVYHRAADSSAPEDYHLELNATAARTDDATVFNDTAPTSTQFTVGTNDGVNKSGSTYVAYLFAHNNSDGEFGPDADQDIIKCGSYTGNGSTTGPEINLGFEPQWLLIKRATGTANWFLVDNIRGLPVGANSNPLFPNSANAESTTGAAIDILPTGFQPKASSIFINNSGDTYIYMAIRRGPLAEPENATDVFNVLKETSANLNQSPPYLQQTGFPVDVVSNKTFDASSSWWTATRLTNARLQLESTAAETGVSSTHEFDHNDGVAVNGLTGSTNFIGYHWRRAPSFFDVVAYTGTGSAQNISHNLGAIPEMIWLKRRDAANFEWIVYHKGLNGGTSPEDYVLYLNATNAEADVAYWDDTAPTSTTFRVSGFGQTGSNGGTYIAYLFATVAGISKVGSYTGTGNTLNIDCGFTNGARFVLIKRSNGIGNWFILDTERGIVAGNDPLLELNSSGAQDSAYDNIDPYSAGFTLTAYGGTSPYLNISGATYIFYAIA